MYKAITILILIAFVACSRSGDSKKAYAAYVAGFEEQFQEIEAQYDNASPAEQEELEADYERLELALVEAQKAFIQDNPDSLRSVFLLYEIDWSFKSAEDFWASNCSPCRHENPYILAAYEEFNDRGFNVLGVSTDTQKDAWLKAIHDDGLVWTNVCSFEKWNDHPIVIRYALQQTSQNFLLDKDGVILAKDLRGEALHEKLSQLLD